MLATGEQAQRTLHGRGFRSTPLAFRPADIVLDRLDVNPVIGTIQGASFPGAWARSGPGCLLTISHPGPQLQPVRLHRPRRARFPLARTAHAAGLRVSA